MCSNESTISFLLVIIYYALNATKLVNFPYLCKFIGVFDQNWGGFGNQHLYMSRKSTTFAEKKWQLWNTNLVLAVVLRLFVSTRTLLSVNVQVWNSLLLLVLIWQCNTPTNASAASVCWSSLSASTVCRISKSPQVCRISLLTYSQNVLFLKIVISFTSLIPSLIPPTGDREMTERTPTQLPHHKSAFS